MKLVAGMISLVGKFLFTFSLLSLMRSFGVGMDLESIPSIRKSYSFLKRRGSSLVARSCTFLWKVMSWFLGISVADDARWFLT